MNRTIQRNVALILLAASTSLAVGNGAPVRSPLASPAVETAASVGPHGGRLLTDGTVVVEVSMAEGIGMDPRLRLDVTRAGNPLPPQSLAFDVTLTRLGGEIDRLSFTPEGDHLISDGIIQEPHSFDVEINARIEGQTHRWQYASYEGRMNLPDADAVARGVRVEAAGPQHLSLTKEVAGAVVAEPTPSIAFNVNRPDLSDMRVGQEIEVVALDGRPIGRSIVTNIKPPFEAGSRATVMTATLPKSVDLPVGTPLKGTVRIGTLDAPLAVRTLALQHFRDSKVVLAQFGDTYEVRMLEIGRQTPEWTEVKSGLKAGTRYVSENVFVLGAQLDKNSPSIVHGH